MKRYTLPELLCAVAKRKKFRECQILAHDTARLWAGESE